MWDLCSLDRVQKLQSQQKAQNIKSFCHLIELLNGTVPFSSIDTFALISQRQLELETNKDILNFRVTD